MRPPGPTGRAGGDGPAGSTDAGRGDLRPLPPATFGLRLDAGARRVDEGRTLIGGSPLRVLRLSAAGARAIDDLAAGRPLGPGPARRRLARRLFDTGLAHPRPVAGGATAGAGSSGSTARTAAGAVAETDSCAAGVVAGASGPCAGGAVAGAGGPFAAGDVTAVVPVRGDPAELDRTLASLARDGLAVIVVDDGSPAPDAQRVAAIAAGWGALLLRRPVNGGPAAARQTALPAVRTPLVAFVDADATPEPGWLPVVLAHLADPAVVAVAPRVRSRPTDGSLRDRFERRHSPLDLGEIEARVVPGSRVAYVPSVVLVARREAIEAVGGFDERLRHGEDVDLVWRLVAGGGTVRYAPEAAATHAPRSTWRAWWRQRVGYGSAAAPLARRHPGAVPPLAVSWWSVAAWLLGAAGHPLGGVAVAAGSTALLPAKLRGRVERPWVEGVRLAGWGHWAAGRWIARAVTRTWWPLALVAALVSRRARLALAAAAVLPALADWDRTIGIDPGRYVALRLADDVAYGWGVWQGCRRARTAAPLVPDLRSWPGRRAAD